ncbi:MAG: hypothetical protein ACRBCS_16310 [Cellvibrionaceae bacterium]
MQYKLTSASSLTPKPTHFFVTRCAQTLTQKHSGFGAAEAGISVQGEFNARN